MNLPSKLHEVQDEICLRRANQARVEDEANEISTNDIEMYLIQAQLKNVKAKDELVNTQMTYWNLMLMTPLDETVESLGLRENKNL